MAWPLEEARSHEHISVMGHRARYTTRDAKNMQKLHPDTPGQIHKSSFEILISHDVSRDSTMYKMLLLSPNKVNEMHL